MARLPGAILDGIEVLPNRSLLVSSWATSSVYMVARGGTVKVVVANVKSPADIGYDRKRDRVLIPLFMESKVQIQALKYPEGLQCFARPSAGLTYSHIGI